MRQYIILFILIGSIYSCVDSEEVKGVEVQGTVLDDNTGVPISNARVTVLSWRKVGEEETYDKVDTVTDNNGRFKVIFERGFKIDVGSISPNYHPVVREITDITKTVNIDIKLSRNTATGTLKNLGQMAVFAREYNNINPSINRAYFGIDLLNGVNTKSLDSMDISVANYSGTDFPKILITSERGGIVPIFNRSTDTITKAPEVGYVSRYELTGSEKGIFVKCRDGKTYARLIIFSLEYDSSSPYKNGSVKDYGIMFNVELQTEGREFNSAADMRLDYYILKKI